MCKDHILTRLQTLLVEIIHIIFLIKSKTQALVVIGLLVKVASVICFTMYYLLTEDWTSSSYILICWKQIIETTEENVKYTQI